MMRLLIRADASVEIGAGHVMRTLALAEALRERGASVHFVSRSEIGHQISILENSGFCVHRLPPVDCEPNETKDAIETMTAVANLEAFDVAVVDHYELGETWERQVRRDIRHVIAIDDLADRAHAVDLLLDQNASSATVGRPERTARGATVFLCGPEYALLRTEFRNVRAGEQLRGGQLKRVLVYYGSSDPTDETSKVLNALIGVEGLNHEVQVVVGGANPRREKIKALCASQPRIFYRCQINDMAATMARADVAFGAAGISAWERCCVGLPSLLTVLSQDQIPVAATVEAAGAGLDLGWYRDLDGSDYLRALSELTPARLTAMEMACLRLVDGKGAERVAEAIFEVAQKCRP